MPQVNEQQLAQKRPTGTSAVSAFSPSVKTVIKSVVICNTTSQATTFSIFIDDDGTDYDEDTAVFFDAPIGANTTVEACTYWPMANSDGNAAVQSGANNAITFTFFGATIP